MDALAEYAACPCGEYHRAALKPTPTGIRCANCRDRRHRRGICRVCERMAPVERHHVGGDAQSPAVIPVCLNCHRVLTLWQKRWRVNQPTLSVAQGVLDCAVLRAEQLPPGDPRAGLPALLRFMLGLALRCWFPELAWYEPLLVLPETLP